MTASDATSGDERPARVLVVEDEAAVAEFARRVLERAGWDVDVAFDGAVALTLLDDPARRYDALVLDRGLPHVSGDALARHAAERRPEAAILVATGDIEDVPPPFDARIEKPYGPNALRDALRDALAVRDARRR
jgi:DNA-binding response OmpR family regulator